MISKGSFRRLLTGQIAFQLVFCATVACVVALAAWELGQNLERRGITTGFEFLGHQSQLSISDSPVTGFVSGASNLHSFAVGALNTALLSLVIIGCATIIGGFVGLMQLSESRILARSMEVYVELTRNVPALMHVLFWYAILRTLPPPRSAIYPMRDVILSNRGLRIPALHADGGADAVWWIGGAALIAFALLRASRRRTHGKSSGRLVLHAALSLLAGLLFAVALGQVQVTLDLPQAQGLSFRGGLNLPIEFAAIAIALSIYYGSYIGEIVRGGFKGVADGQREAARSLGLRPHQTTRLVIFPQALRMIIPPVTSEYISIFKTTSLSIVIGYQDFTAVAAAITNNTGQAIEPMVLLAGFYFVGSWAISLTMSRYHKGLNGGGGR